MTIEYPGAKQLLAARNLLLAEYDRAREHARAHEVETHHGNVAEDLVRDWLRKFLPQRYGVTSGYIVSQVPVTGKLPHFDVIIYDQLESPVLWIEDSPGKTDSGSSRAIPVEYVKAVIEVKVALNAKSAKHAMEHLADLLPQLAAFDAPNERYHKFLPSNFFCSCLFIELRPEDALHVSTLRHLLPAKTLRGYFGADILRGVSRSADDCGQFRLMHLPSQAEHKMPVTNSLLHGISCTDCVSYEDLPCALQGMLMWSHINFARFAFDILALLDGTFEIGRVSSFYGFGQQPPSE